MMVLSHTMVRCRCRLGGGGLLVYFFLFSIFGAEELQEYAAGMVTVVFLVLLW